MTVFKMYVLNPASSLVAPQSRALIGVAKVPSGRIVTEWARTGSGLRGLLGAEVSAWKAVRRGRLLRAGAQQPFCGRSAGAREELLGSGFTH